MCFEYVFAPCRRTCYYIDLPVSLSSCKVVSFAGLCLRLFWEACFLRTRMPFFVNAICQARLDDPGASGADLHEKLPVVADYDHGAFERGQGVD